jgi:hypothetical protein
MKDKKHRHTATEAQINANRSNSQKSTGPRGDEGNDEGKAASTRNGLTHGLCANKHLILDEDSGEFLALLHDLCDRFHPVGDGEEILVRRIAAGQWRLDRAFPMEAAIFRDRLKVVAKRDAEIQRIYAMVEKNAATRGEPAPPPPALPGRAFMLYCESAHSFTNLTRYETSLERSIDRSLRQLKAYQVARQALSDMPQPAVEPVAEQALPSALCTSDATNATRDRYIEMRNKRAQAARTLAHPPVTERNTHGRRAGQPSI